MLQNRVKYVLAVVTFLLTLVWFAYSADQWTKNTIGYATLDVAEKKSTLHYIKGYWEKSLPMRQSGNEFIFFMKDENGRVAKVIYDNGKPNNFEQATSIVVQGVMEDGELYAKDILVKCPSKYQSENAVKSNKI